MIGYLKGNTMHVDEKSIILDVSGTGYEVLLPLSSLLKIKTGSELSLYVHSHVREDQFTLFGFDNLEEKESGRSTS